MANVLVLRGQEYVLGDLTAATLEDMPEACEAFFAIRAEEVDHVTGENLRAAITLGAEAIRRGGIPTMTREMFRELVQLPDLAALYQAVARALGVGRGKGKAVAPGEAPSPGASQQPETSSGA